MPTGDRFVEVPAEAMFEFLQSKGFQRAEERSHREVVYERRHHVDGRYKVLVYTSVTTRHAKARGLGADAIRVVAIFELAGVTTQTRGVAKTKRVFRTGTVEGVLARMLERMRDAYAVINRKVDDVRRVQQATP